MALIAYTTFLLFSIVGRIVMQYRKTGDTGLRPINSKSSVVSKIASILLFISFLVTFSISIMEAIGYILPQVSFGKLGMFTGSSLCVSGVIVTVISQYQMGNAWRIGVDETDKTDLITHGLYSYVRNPIYCGVMLFGIGLLFLIPHVYMMFALLIGYLSIELQVRYIEEVYMLNSHGEEFKKYSIKVNRYFPKLSALGGKIA